MPLVILGIRKRDNDHKQGYTNADNIKMLT